MSKPRNIRAGARLTVGQAARLAAKEGHAETALATGVAREVRDRVIVIKQQLAAGVDVPRPAMRTKTRLSTRATYLKHMSDGMTQAEIAKMYGVSRQSVHQLTTGYEEKRLQNKEQDARRRAGAREYTCGVCGIAGHNARSHQNGDIS